MRGTRRVAVALLVGLLLTGCGEQSERSRDDASAVPDDPSATATADGNGELVPALPQLSRSPTRSKAPTRKPVKNPLGPVFGADASWPQCPKGLGIPEKRTEGRPMPTAAARFVVLGLTNGPSFVANPCLADQVQWVKERHLMGAAYSILSYPDERTLARLRTQGPYDGRTRLGGLRNVGYQAALFNVATMRRVGLGTPVVWIDVEPVIHFDWSADLEANAAVVQGTAGGYQDAGFRIGFYSIGSLWTRVVGDLRFGAPEWRPAGERGLGEALTRCGDDWSFQGGQGVLGQWIEDGRDRDVTCPGAVSELSRWFHQY